MLIIILMPIPILPLPLPLPEPLPGIVKLPPTTVFPICALPPTVREPSEPTLAPALAVLLATAAKNLLNTKDDAKRRIARIHFEHNVPKICCLILYIRATYQ